MKSPDSVLFLGKANDPHCENALHFCRAIFSDVDSFLGAWGDPLPEGARTWKGDFIISYLSRWVVPIPLLEAARKAAINFHPASPEFPGIGCTNFALYEGAAEYGVTCHHMWEKVDTGPIIATRRFPIYPSDDVAALLDRTYKTQFALFLEITALMAAGKTLPNCGEKWTRMPYTRREFDALNSITPGMSGEEEARRIRACAFGPYTPKRIMMAA